MYMSDKEQKSPSNGQQVLGKNKKRNLQDRTFYNHII